MESSERQRGRNERRLEMLENGNMLRSLPPLDSSLAPAAAPRKSAARGALCAQRVPSCSQAHTLPLCAGNSLGSASEYETSLTRPRLERPRRHGHAAVTDEHTFAVRIVFPRFFNPFVSSAATEAPRARAETGRPFPPA